MNTSGTSDKRLVLATLMPALALTLAFVPIFLTLPNEGDGWSFWLIVGAAPLAAFIVNLRLPAATTQGRAILTGVPQILLLPLLFYVDILIDDSRGYYIGGDLDYDRGFAVSIGTLVGFMLGFILMVLVAVGALLGTWLGGRRR
jgi:hypothetical protein